MLNLQSGARNLLENCAGLRAGQSLLILYEDPTTGYYDPDLAPALAQVAASLGIRVDLREVPFIPQALDPSPDLLEQMRAHDRTLFLSRIGDQLRFSAGMADIHPVVSYALDCDMLASGFGRAHHAAFVALKNCLNAALSQARLIHVTCPLGTDFSGPGAVFPGEAGEVTVTRFPLSVFSPVPPAGFSGRIAQAGFLTGTGSNYYFPYNIPLDGVLFVTFQDEHLTGFEGLAQDVARARAHYDAVGQKLGIKPDLIHSWHAGIHPGCAYHRSAGSNVERWGGSAFGNPRILHFHTCGDYAPGEISINVIDPTISLDGIAVWENGRLHPERVPGGAEILAQYPCAAAVFADPAIDIGLGPNGRLGLVTEQLA